MFKYVGGELSIQSQNKITSLSSVAKTHEEPVYVYDGDSLNQRLRVYRDAVPSVASIHYALKANNNGEILKAIREQDFGLDVVSGGELELGLSRGFDPRKIVFSGVGKTEYEIKKALKTGILQLNVESLPELERIAKIAERLNTKAPVALRINPDVDADTHPYIRTGFRENKFGIDITDIGSAMDIIRAQNSRLDFLGLTLHIGSQIQDVTPFENAFQKTATLVKRLRADGIVIRSLDFGGGVGIDYFSDDLAGDEKRIRAYGKALATALKELPDIQLRLEPGRILVARAGVLVGRVEYVKRTPHKNFVILNTGMHHLMRPSLYQAHHRILPCIQCKGAEETFDVVGPICESADTLGHERRLPANIKSGDYIAIMDAGAYGAVMMSDYNCQARAKETFIASSEKL